MVYPNLTAEMARRNITVNDVAHRLGKHADTVRNWMRGKGDFQMQTAIEVRNEFFPECSIEYLFSKEPYTNQSA